MDEPVIIEEIYDAAFDDESFSSIAERLSGWFGARSTLIHWMHHDGNTDILAHSGYFTDEQLALYALEFAAIDPWIKSTAGAPNRVHNLEELVPVDEYVATSFYNDYIRAMGDDTCRGIGIRLENRWGSGFVALQRGRSQDPFEPSSIQSLKRNFPHLRRMLSIRGRVAAGARRESSLRAGLEALGQPIVACDPKGVVSYLNSAAEDLVREETFLRLRDGRLRAATDDADRLLLTAVKQAARSNSSGASAIRLRGRNGTWLTVTATPAPRGEAAGGVIILAGAPALAHDDRTRRLRQAHGLTSAEAILAVMLADGMSPAEIASSREVSVGTVQAQIKSIAFKLGCRRQGDIIRTVLQLPALYCRR